jgi:hypothetical protein
MAHRMRSLTVFLFVGLYLVALAGCQSESGGTRVSSEGDGRSGVNDEADVGEAPLLVPGVGVEVAALPPGFEPWLDANTITEAIDDSEHSYQEFHNDKTGQRLTIAMTRGKPIEGLLRSDTGEVMAEALSPGVRNHPTYFFDYRIVSGDISVAWAIDETTMGWVSGSGLSTDELLEIARSIRIVDREEETVR